jgi:hypothetical protein
MILWEIKWQQPNKERHHKQENLPLLPIKLLLQPAEGIFSDGPEYWQRQL